MKTKLAILIFLSLTGLRTSLIAQNSKINNDYNSQTAIALTSKESENILCPEPINPQELTENDYSTCLSDKGNENATFRSCKGASYDPYKTVNNKISNGSTKGSTDINKIFNKGNSIGFENNTGIKEDNRILKDISTTPSTFFIDKKCKAFYINGEWWWQSFSVFTTTTFVIRFASQYGADAAIFTEDDRFEFENNLAFSGWGVFDNQIGYLSVTLAPGNYYVGMRNQISGTNYVSIELDYTISLPSYDNCSFYDYYLDGVYNLSAGGKLWQLITIQNLFRYFIDGINSGVDVFFIPPTELSNFQNNQSFQYYIDYTQSTCGEGPGFFEIMLPSGTYYMVARNNSLSNHSINYAMERWIINNNTPIENITTENKILIYPNPGINSIIIEQNASDFCKDEIISFYNLQGQIILQKLLIDLKSEVDISKLTKGFYIIKIESNEGVTLKRFVKE
jgi:hypothetical protein